MNYERLNKIEEILVLALENQASKEQLRFLNQSLRSDPELLQHCSDILTLSATLKKTDRVLNVFIESDKQEYSDFLQQLADEEKTAPGICIIEDNPKAPFAISRELHHPVIVPKINKLSLFTTLASLAALLLVIAYFHLTPQSTSVATVKDCLGVQFADNREIAIGSPLTNQKDSYWLKSGILEIEFEYGATVVIESPAEFKLDSADKMTLNSGRLYAKVPNSAVGFIVDTPNSRVVDLGTEFGVISDASGNTEVHVFKGKTVLVGGGQKAKKSTLNLTAGNAGTVSNNGTTVKKIQYTPNAFVQGIHSKTGFVWKGESSIPLNNVLAGRIFDIEPEGVEIDPTIGEHVIHENYVSGAMRQGDAKYQIMDSPFIDGTFIPFGQQPQIISSTGLSYQFPITSAYLHYNLSDRESIYDGVTKEHYPLLLRSDAREQSSLLLHPNMGITIDLDQVREKIPTLEIQHFRADCGIAFSARQALEKAYPDGDIPDEDNPSVDFTILLDGKVLKELTGIRLDSGVHTIDVDINSTDRFLTLVATDGNQSFIHDWFVLADPVLEISTTE